MRHRLVTLALAASLASLTGCATAAPVADQARTPDVEVSVTPTPTAELDLADPANWLISASGIGPITLGQSLNDAALALAAFTPQAVPCDNVNYRMYQLNEDIGMTLATEDGLTVRGVAITTGFDRVATVASPLTAEGIGLGSTIADVQAAYPDATGSAGTSEYTHVVDGDIWISFSPEFGDSPGILSVDVARGWALPSEYC